MEDTNTKNTTSFEKETKQDRIESELGITADRLEIRLGRLASFPAFLLGVICGICIGVAIVMAEIMEAVS